MHGRKASDRILQPFMYQGRIAEQMQSLSENSKRRIRQRAPREKSRARPRAKVFKKAGEGK